MKWKDLNKPENYVYLVFLLLGLLGVAYLKGIETVLVLIAFLGTACFTIYVVGDAYTSIRYKTNDFSLIKVICFVVFSTITYYFYGSYAVLRAFSLGFVLATTMILYVSFKNRK